MRSFRLKQIKGAKEILESQGFKKFITRSYRRFLTDPDVEIKKNIKKYSNDYKKFIDIGAAVGDITLSSCKYFSNCVCFEPEKKNFKKLQKRIEESDVKNIKIYDYALGKEFGKKKFFVSKTSNLDNRFNVEKNENFVEVEVKVETLDRMCEKIGINEKCFIKIDVQGAELDVMKGASKLLEKDCIIISEFWPWAMQLNDLNPSDYVEYMKSKGYDFFDLKNNKLTSEFLNKICVSGDKKFIHDDFILKKINHI